MSVYIDENGNAVSRSAEPYVPKLADELEALAKAIRTAIEYMPYLDRQKEDDDGDYLPLTLREFYEETWQGSYADELFQDVENVIITALRQPVADEAQRLQDHMEQHYGVCLQASQWDAAITALRQPDAVPGDLVERLNWAMGQLHNCQQWHEEPDPDGKGTLYDWIIQGTDNGR